MARTFHERWLEERYERWLEEEKDKLDKWLGMLIRIHKGFMPAIVDAVLSCPSLNYWDKVFAITRLVELVIHEVSEQR